MAVGHEYELSCLIFPPLKVGKAHTPLVDLANRMLVLKVMRTRLKDVAIEVSLET